MAQSRNHKRFDSNDCIFTCGLSLFPATTLDWNSGFIIWLWDSSRTLLCSCNFFSHSAVPLDGVRFEPPEWLPGPPLGQTAWSLDQSVLVLGCESSVNPLEESIYFFIRISNTIYKLYRQLHRVQNSSLLNITLFTGAAEGNGTSAAWGVRESVCGMAARTNGLIFDISSFNSRLIMSSWIFLASYTLNKLLSDR